MADWMKRAAGAAVATALLASGAASAETAAVVERVERGALQLEAVPDIPAAVSEGLRRYASARGAGFQGWAGEGVLISTRFGETSQIHHVAQPLGARRQLTFYDEPVGGALAHPGGAAFAFSRDTGGDEFFQAFAFDLATGEVTQLSEPGTRNGALAWSEDGASAAWYRARSGEADWDVLAADLSDPEGSRRVVLEGEGAMFPLDWAPAGDALLVSKYISITKSHMYVLDLESGDLRELNADLDIAYAGGTFIEGGAAILTTTDKDSEFRRLARMDAATGAITPLTTDVDWDVEGFDVAPDGASAVFSVNAGGLSQLKMIDLGTGAISDGPSLPAGIVGGLEFRSDGAAVGFTLNRAAGGTDVYSFTLADGAVTRWTESEIGGLDPDGFVEPRLIAYPNADGDEIPAFVFAPEGDGPHPVVVSIHGGPEAQYRPRFSPTVQYWVNELGVAVVAPNVRGSAGYGKTYVAADNGFNRKKSVEDIGALLDWIAAEDSLDEDRVVVFGGSYGGYMVLASMVDYGDRLAGGVNIVGISNFVTFLENTQGYRRDLRRAEYGDERDPEMRAFLEEISPLNSADEIDKPIFIAQGLNDPRVPASESEQILAAVRGNGGTAWYLLATNEGHGFRKRANRDYFNAATALFFDEVLGLDRLPTGAGSEG